MHVTSEVETKFAAFERSNPQEALDSNSKSNSNSISAFLRQKGASFLCAMQSEIPIQPHKGTGVPTLIGSFKRACDVRVVRDYVRIQMIKRVHLES